MALDLDYPSATEEVCSPVLERVSRFKIDSDIIYRRNFFMPTISMFYGILVLMFFRDNKRHHLPHIHARYQSDEAAISLEDGSVLDGNIPPKQLKMVQAWIEIHKDELYVDWDLAVNGDEPFRIAPLQ